MAGAGANVIATGRRQVLVDEASLEIEKLGRQTLRRTCDAMDRESIDALREAVLKQFGRVINIASLNSYVALVEVAAYAASKGAVLSLTRSLAVEWAPKGVV